MVTAGSPTAYEIRLTSEARDKLERFRLAVRAARSEVEVRLALEDVAELPAHLIERALHDREVVAGEGEG